MSKYVAKTKEFVLEVQPEVNMEVPRQTQCYSTDLYPNFAAAQTRFRNKQVTDEEFVKIFADGAQMALKVARQEQEIYLKKIKAVAIKSYINFGAYGAFALTSEILESDQAYEARVARTLRGRKAAEKRKATLEKRTLEKDKSALTEILSRYGALNSVKVDDIIKQP